MHWSLPKPVCAVLALLLVAACQTPPPALQPNLPAGQTLVRDGLGASGNLLVTVDDAAAGCRAPKLWHSAGADWHEAARGPAVVGAGCPAATALLAADDRTLAVYDFSAGKAVVLDLLGNGFAPAGVASITPPAGFPFPAPGPNLAFSGDGKLLLLGSLNRACRRTPAGGRACGTAELFERRQEHWIPTASFLPTPERDGRIRYGQAVALTPAGDLALVGGTGEPGLSGALWVYALSGTEPRLVQILGPPKLQGGFANDLSLAADGSWLAVGAEQSVFLYERIGEGFVYRRTLMPPDLDAGQFGETVALSADGRRLLVGAPRTACAAGDRCGRAYLFERDLYWELAQRLHAAEPTADANFSHHLALSADGRVAAIQGNGLQVVSLGPPDR